MNAGTFFCLPKKSASFNTTLFNKDPLSSSIGETIFLKINECRDFNPFVEKKCKSKEEIDDFVDQIFVDVMAVYDNIDFSSTQQGLRKREDKPVF